MATVYLDSPTFLGHSHLALPTGKIRQCTPSHHEWFLHFKSATETRSTKYPSPRWLYLLIESPCMRTTPLSPIIARVYIEFPLFTKKTQDGGKSHNRFTPIKYIEDVCILARRGANGCWSPFRYCWYSPNATKGMGLGRSPRRWVVACIPAWPRRHRHLGKDFKHCTLCTEGCVYPAYLGRVCSILFRFVQVEQMSPRCEA